MRNIVKETVRYLRRKQTPAEQVLWEAIRNRSLKGCKFLRQYPIIFEDRGLPRFLIADFYSHEARLVIELDGPVHERQKDYDDARTVAIRDLGLRVIRFKNRDVLSDIGPVMSKIEEELTPLPPSL